MLYLQHKYQLFDILQEKFQLENLPVVQDLIDSLQPKKRSRRAFLGNAAKLTANLFVANTVVYVVGQVSHDLDGSLVAGAKTCEWTRGKKSILNECETIDYTFATRVACESHNARVPHASPGCESLYEPCSCY